MAYTLEELARHAGGRVEGDGSCEITAVATIESAGDGEISFLSNRKYARYLEDTKASAVILQEDDRGLCPCNAIVVANPYLAFAKISALLNPEDTGEAGIHPSAVIAGDSSVAASASVGAGVVVGASAVIGENVVIAPGCVIGSGVEIGAGTRLHANVTIEHGVKIGERVILHPGVVVGSDGFGIANDDGVWVKVPQVGTVIIGDDVEIGANTTIDRGALEDTVIHNGVKLDNQIQVAHNVIIGEHTAIAGCTGIAGSAKIGARCAIGGGSVILGHLEIADGVQITAMSLVTKSIRAAGVYSSGTPVQDNDLWRRNVSRFKRLDDMAKKIRDLEQRIKDLE